MIKISHETPVLLLRESRNYNQYSYCLPHLMDQSDEYRDFFLEEKELGREIYLDNSLHELKVAYNFERLIHWIEELRPSNFFIPDVWEDKDASIVNAKKWSKIKLPKGVQKIAVIQGKSLGDAIECTQIYKDLGYKKLAFSYGASYYNDLFPHPNQDFGKAMGRLLVISKLHKMKLLNNSDKVHLLGSSIWSEFQFYKDFKFIESIDTSAPIMAALEGKNYNNSNYFESKPILNLNTTQFWGKDKITEFEISLAKHNVKMFKKTNKL